MEGSQRVLQLLRHPQLVASRLYHLELREVDEALALYDGPIRATRSSEWLDVDDAASLLWRLQLFGVAIGDRARTLLEDVEEPMHDPVSVFNDWHAVMIAGLADAPEVCEQLILHNRSASDGTNRRAIDAAGLQLLEGFAAFAGGDTTSALHRLIDIKPKSHVVGGSHAQRDVIDLTLIAGQRGRVTSLWQRPCSRRGGAQADGQGRRPRVDQDEQQRVTQSSARP